MDDQEKAQQPTDAQNQATEDEGIDFGDETQDQQDENSAPPDTKEETPDPKPINQEAVEKRINKLTFEKYEERRKREELEERLRQIEEEAEKQRASQSDIQIPEVPDIYDDDYDTKLKAREEALAKAAAEKAKKDFLKEQQQKEFHAKAQAENSRINKQVDEMYANASKYGISREELDDADRTVSQFLNNQDLAKFILAQKDSALIVKYLASSPIEMEKIRGMDALNASVHIATKIIPETDKLKPGVTKTPDPIDIPEKSGSPRDKFLEGVTFE